MIEIPPNHVVRYSAIVSAQCWAATQWRLVTWAGVTDCWLLECFYPGYLLFFSDPCPVSSVQGLPGDRVMTPPLHCPTDTQDTATTGTALPHHQGLDNIPRSHLLYCLHFYYKEVRPTCQKLNSPRRDHIGCILNHHIKNSRSLGLWAEEGGQNNLAVMRGALLPRDDGLMHICTSAIEQSVWTETICAYDQNSQDTWCCHCEGSKCWLVNSTCQCRENIIECPYYVHV